MKEATRSAVNKVIWPTSMKIALSGVPPPEFSAKVNGRIAPVGTFQTNLGALEYFYRLAGPLELNDTTTARCVGVTERWMVCEPGKRQVAFEVLFHFVNPLLQQIGSPVGATWNISAMGVFVFDREGRICSYDWDLRRLGLVVEAAWAPLYQLVGGEAVFNEQLVQFTCQAAAAFCTGANSQYNNQADCEKFLRSLPVGNYDSADQDNLICRSLHAALVPLRPAVHCAHIGPSGGGKTSVAMSSTTSRTTVLLALLLATALAGLQQAAASADPTAPVDAAHMRVQPQSEWQDRASGYFPDNLGALEYFYRLAGPLDINDTTSARCVGVKERWMVCEQGKRQVAFEMLFQYVNPVLQQINSPVGATYNFSALGVFVFDRAGRICSYDYDLRRLGLVTDSALAPMVQLICGPKKIC
ncbi:hypothetical protein OEZ85_008068 [Tetradesmus obliquus]|uniref:Uncharacterized protein n=1 Tax=Tetradesmus obliquus TaxID=3088 RepID=A0ABY8TI26_TETOB|nr:hypothetical protein OEZ85_008068 [Tetradesmus obliquus]